MNKIDYVLTYWLKVKLKRKDQESWPEMSSKDSEAIVKIYEDYEERKRLKKIKFSLLFNNNFIETEK